MAQARFVQRTKPAWHVVDATDEVVGRLSHQVARLLQGKHKPSYVPQADSGDYVVIVNADKVQFTGRKMRQKLYRWHTGYPGGLKSRAAWEVLQRKPANVLKSAVAGMLPKNGLRKHVWMKKLRVYAGAEHPHMEETAASAAVAGPYLAQYAPASKQLLAKAQPIEGVSDVVLEEGEEEEGEGQLLPDDVMQGIFLFRMRETLDAEVEFWAARGEDTVPARALEPHGLVQTGPGQFKFADSGDIVPPLEEVAHFGAMLDAIEGADTEEAAEEVQRSIAAGEGVASGR